MDEFEFRIAETLDDTWANFEPDFSLPSGSPFYVERPGHPLGQLRFALLARWHTPPKYFLSGHRGCGKSTELNRLVADPRIQGRYWPVTFSVREVLDVGNLDYLDVLFAVGAQLFAQYVKGGGKLDKGLLGELEEWRNRVEERVKAKGASLETGAGLDLMQFFLGALLRLKTEHTTRVTVRQVLEPQLSELIEKINLIATVIHAREKKPPLLLIDDLDKPSLEQSHKLFVDNLGPLTQLAFPIIYTIPSGLFYTRDFTAGTLRESRFFLPNVKLHPKGDRNQRDPAGWETMRQFFTKRAQPNLITTQALNEAITASGGLFREMCHLIRFSVYYASADKRQRIELPDVTRAAGEIRNDFRRVLGHRERTLLRQVQAINELREPDEIAPLLHMLAVLEYANGGNWIDIHPVLNQLLDETKIHDQEYEGDDDPS